MKYLVVSSLVIMTSVLVSTVVKAGIPLNNLEGVGGIAFNPLAYTAGTYPEKPQSKQEKTSLDNIFSKPQIGAWYINLGDVDIDWTTFGVAETFLNVLRFHTVTRPSR